MSKYKLKKEKLEEVQKISNRSTNQTQFLFNLLKGNYERLLKLEKKIKEKFISYCPDNEKEVIEILN